MSASSAWRCASSSSTSSSRRALILYKSILRAHERYLPSQSMRQLGDTYVKSEFRLHKAAKPEQAALFFVEWEKYLQHIEQTGREKQSIEMGLLVNPRSQPQRQQLQQRLGNVVSDDLMPSSSSSSMIMMMSLSSSTSSSLQQHSIKKQSQNENDDNGGSTIYFGKDISNDIVLSDEQVSKLEQLKDEATKAAVAASASASMNNIEGDGNGGSQRQ